MAKKNHNQKKRANKQKAAAPIRNEPWISQRSGFIMIGLLSVVLAVFMGWQLYPTEGLWTAVLYGLGFAAALWIVFGLSLAFNYLVRGKR